MNFAVIDEIIEYVKKNIDKIFEITNMSEYNENFKLYSIEYKDDVENFIKRVERNLNRLLSAGIIIGVDEIFQQFVLCWLDLNAFEYVDVCNNLKVFIRDMLYNIYYRKKEN